MMPREILPVIEGERSRRKGLARVMHEKPSWQDHAYAHTLGDVTLKEMRSMPRGGGAVAERNRLRKLHWSAHSELSLIDSEVARAMKDLARLDKVKIKIPDREERRARYKAIIDGADERRKTAKEKIHSTNSDLPLADRKIHLIF